MAVASANIPFGTDESQGLEELAGAAPLSLNVLADAAGAVRKRPAIIPWTDFPTPAVASPVVGITTLGDYVVYVTQDRAIHAWLGPSNVIDIGAVGALDSDQRPVFAKNHSNVIIAGGGLLQKWNGVTALSARLGGSPPRATHVAWLAQRLVVNVRGPSGEIQWSEPGDSPGNETWPALNFAEMEANPDTLPALYASIGELVGLGTDSLEMMAPDPAAGFAPVRVLPNGTIAPYSFIGFEDNFAFLDNLKRFVALNGRSSAVGPDASGVISAPSMTKSLKNLDASDTWGFRLNMGPWDALVWVMPTDGRSFVYNLDAKSWSEWSSWGPSGRLPIAITSHCYNQSLGLHLVGDSTGKINVLDLDSADDNGSPIVADCISGFVSRGSLNTKVNRQLNLTFRRGAGTFLGTSPKAYLSWRDNTGAFQPPMEIDLGTASDVETTVSFYSLGTYKTRQWRLTMSDAAPFILVQAQESYEVLEV